MYLKEGFMAAFDDVFKTVQGWLKAVTELGASLIVVFVVLGILFPDFSFVIDNIADIVGNIAEDGVAGLIALLLLLLIYRR